MDINLDYIHQLQDRNARQRGMLEVLSAAMRNYADVLQNRIDRGDKLDPFLETLRFNCDLVSKDIDREMKEGNI